MNEWILIAIGTFIFLLGNAFFIWGLYERKRKKIASQGKAS